MIVKPKRKRRFPIERRARSKKVIRPRKRRAMPRVQERAPSSVGGTLVTSRCMKALGKHTLRVCQPHRRHLDSMCYGFEEKDDSGEES